MSQAHDSVAGLVTVAIPVRNGAALLDRTLHAVREQRLADGRELEILVCDSGSEDDSVAIARRWGAEVISIEPAEFSHGGTRNLLMDRSRGEYVALLTQDSVPAGEGWLSGLLDGFGLAPDVGLVFGPYQPRPEASIMSARELVEWFASFSADGSPRVDRLAPEERDLPPVRLMGQRGFFTDANGCLSRAAWRRVPFRDVAYAEDHALAHDMLRAGFAKVFMPDAAVIHSHEYGPAEWLRRSFDEARGVREIYGVEAKRGLTWFLTNVWGLVRADLRFARELGVQGRPGVAGHSLAHHGLRSIGTLLGERAGSLPAPVIRRLSLERRH